MMNSTASIPGSRLKHCEMKKMASGAVSVEKLVGIVEYGPHN